MVGPPNNEKTNSWLRPYPWRIPAASPPSLPGRCSIPAAIRVVPAVGCTVLPAPPLRPWWILPCPSLLHLRSQLLATSELEARCPQAFSGLLQLRGTPSRTSSSSASSFRNIQNEIETRRWRLLTTVGTTISLSPIELLCWP
ncbi:hypothetical protein PVAP13_9KG256526 [Panicum virgatum]|uniref:Uncharacterized protein n=1 Tax=Panicum virgatum TaxID=38727 RepID=A0A8T0NMB7_PANVG|nr:hypothetical protein PVAP13_9KG256526 [Panicum virgatum]